MTVAFAAAPRDATVARVGRLSGGRTGAVGCSGFGRVLRAASGTAVRAIGRRRFLARRHAVTGPVDSPGSLTLMFPCRPCLSRFRRRASEALSPSSEGRSVPPSSGPLLLRPAGGTGGISFCDISIPLLSSGGDPRSAMRHPQPPNNVQSEKFRADIKCSWGRPIFDCRSRIMT